MPRQPRLDAPRTVHHIMGRGLTARRYYKKQEEEDLLTRRLLFQLAVRKMGYPGAEVVRLLFHRNP